MERSKLVQNRKRIVFLRVLLATITTALVVASLDAQSWGIHSSRDELSRRCFRVDLDPSYFADEISNLRRHRPSSSLIPRVSLTDHGLREALRVATLIARLGRQKTLSVEVSPRGGISLKEVGCFTLNNLEESRK